MSKATIKRFLMLLSSAKESQQQQLYQLLQKAESCHCLRDKRGQYEFGKALSLFSYPFNLIGDYYQAFYLHKIGQVEQATEKLERVRREVKGIYADKAALTLSGIKEVSGDIDESMRIRLALSKSEFLPIVVESAIGIAAVLSSQGEHDKAMEELERVLPLISKLGNIPLPFDVLNSYATELAEVGKLELASEVITPVILSPYTSSYPNWLETGKDINEKSSRKSMVTFNRSNVIHFPIKESEEPQEAEEPPTPKQRFPYEHYIRKEFNIQDKVEDWMYAPVEPNDFGTLMIALAESDDNLERDMIIEKVIDSTFPHTPEGKAAKAKWRESIISKIEDES